MPHRVEGYCISCGVTVAKDDPAVSITLFCRTVGIENRKKAPAEQLYICTRCATRLAMSPKPQNGQINVSVWNNIRLLLARHEGVMLEAWADLVKRVEHPELTEGEIMAPVKALKAG